MVLDKSFKQYDDGFTAFNEHVLFQKQQELLYRVDQFAFNDWTDVQLDSDVIMGRCFTTVLATPQNGTFRCCSA